MYKYTYIIKTEIAENNWIIQKWKVVTNNRRNKIGKRNIDEHNKLSNNSNVNIMRIVVNVVKMIIIIVTIIMANNYSYNVYVKDKFNKRE